MKASETSHSPSFLLNNSTTNVASVGIHCEGERVTSNAAAGGILQEVAGCRDDDDVKLLFSLMLFMVVLPILENI